MVLPLHSIHSHCDKSPVSMFSSNLDSVQIPANVLQGNQHSRMCVYAEVNKMDYIQELAYNDYGC